MQAEPEVVHFHGKNVALNPVSSPGPLNRLRSWQQLPFCCLTFLLCPFSMSPYFGKVYDSVFPHFAGQTPCQARFLKDPSHAAPLPQSERNEETSRKESFSCF